MMEKLLSTIKYKSIIIPGYLLKSFRKLDISEKELIVISYLLNSDNNLFNYQKIVDDLGYEMKDILMIMNGLSERNLVKIDVKKDNAIHYEYANFDGLFEKLGLTIAASDTPKKEETKKDLYSLFETEFGRTLSPMEVQIIGAWMEAGFSEEIIKEALKEAVYNGVSRLNYIDKILYEWRKKGINNKSDIEKNKQNFQKKYSEQPKKELYEYDWLNEE